MALPATVEPSLHPIKGLLQAICAHHCLGYYLKRIKNLFPVGMLTVIREERILAGCVAFLRTIFFSE